MCSSKAYAVTVDASSDDPLGNAAFMRQAACFHSPPTTPATSALAAIETKVKFETLAPLLLCHSCQPEAGVQVNNLGFSFGTLNFKFKGFLCELNCLLDWLDSLCYKVLPIITLWIPLELPRLRMHVGHGAWHQDRS